MTSPLQHVDSLGEKRPLNSHLEIENTQLKAEIVRLKEQLVRVRRYFMKGQPRYQAAAQLDRDLEGPIPNTRLENVSTGNDLGYTQL